MTELLLAVICLAVLLALGICSCMALDRFHAFMWRWRNPPEKLAAKRREFERRLLNPDWEFYEQHLQRPIPVALRELFANHDLILGRQHVEVVSVEQEDSTDHISEFWPLDEQTLRESQEYGINAVPFACGDGLLIYLRPGPSETNAVFSMWDELGSESQSELAPDVESFVRNLRATSN